MLSLVAVAASLLRAAKDHLTNSDEGSVQRRREQVLVIRIPTVRLICHVTRRGHEFHLIQHLQTLKSTTTVRLFSLFSGEWKPDFCINFNSLSYI